MMLGTALCHSVRVRVYVTSACAAFVCVSPSRICFSVFIRLRILRILCPYTAAQFCLFFRVQRHRPWLVLDTLLKVCEE
jgi:hypothetical protein